MLRATGLTKRYGDVVALRGVDFAVDAGSVVALLGRNGAGKTTMLSIIAGLLEPDAGEILVDGVDVRRHRSAAATRIGIAPQETGIYRVLTVRENLEFFGEIAGLDRATRRARAEEVGEALGLSALLDRTATTLSGGEARRLHTACALVHAPPLLLLDEPTVGADVATRNQLIASVRALAADGAAVVYTTHYLPEVEALDADIVVIDEGALLARGTRAELVATYFAAGVELEMATGLDLAALPRLDGLEPTVVGPRRWHLRGQTDVADIVRRLDDHAPDIVAIEASRPDLERVFLEITGRGLEDEVDR
ncbi:MAG: ABC transporter ATP-binding protein [Acidimicrobiales bacterium]|nr:ABC transporter ATP-binding protein [Acidimicrobiales bacterium]